MVMFAVSELGNSKRVIGVISCCDLVHLFETADEIRNPSELRYAQIPGNGGFFCTSESGEESSELLGRWGECRLKWRTFNQMIAPLTFEEWYQDCYLKKYLHV